MISQQLLTESDILESGYGYYVDYLPSVSSGDLLINGDNENEFISNEFEQFNEVYVAYDGAFSVFNNVQDASELIGFTTFLGFAVGMMLVAICALIRVSIDAFNKIIK